MRNTRSHLLNGPAVSLFGLAAGNLQVRTFLLFKLLCRASSLHREPQVGEANELRCRTNLPAGIQRNTLKLVLGKFSWFQFPFVHVLRPRILVTAMETLHSLIFLLNWIYLLETLHSLPILSRFFRGLDSRASRGRKVTKTRFQYVGVCQLVYTANIRSIRRLRIRWSKQSAYESTAFNGLLFWRGTFSVACFSLL